MWEESLRASLQMYAGSYSSPMWLSHLLWSLTFVFWSAFFLPAQFRILRLRKLRICPPCSHVHTQEGCSHSLVHRRLRFGKHDDPREAVGNACFPTHSVQIPMCTRSVSAVSPILLKSHASVKYACPFPLSPLLSLPASLLVSVLLLFYFLFLFFWGAPLHSMCSTNLQATFSDLEIFDSELGRGLRTLLLMDVSDLYMDFSDMGTC